jgi:hypothetical protein
VVPLLVGTELVVGPRGELRVGELAHAERVVEEVDVVEHRVDLLLDLVFRAEDVGVVLAELPRAGQALEAAGRLVAVEDGGLGVADRQVAVAAELRVEQQHVAGAVHRLQAVERVAVLDPEQVRRRTSPSGPSASRARRPT